MPRPVSMAGLVEEKLKRYDGWGADEAQLQRAMLDGSPVRFRDAGFWVTEYLVDFGAILAVDHTRIDAASLRFSVYEAGVSSLAAIYTLLPEEERGDFERAIVLAGRGGQRNELIRFAARYLRDEPERLQRFRSDYEGVLADPGLGGLVDAVVRANPQTSGVAELLRPPPPSGPLRAKWAERLERLPRELEPSWLGKVLMNVAYSRLRT